MKILSFKDFIIVFFILNAVTGYSQKSGIPVWQNKEFKVYNDRIVQQDKYVAKALSAKELTSNYQSAEGHLDSHWLMSKDASAFPQYKSDFILSDAIYNLALEEMIKAVEPDSTFRTGKEWAGVWTRDISYSIIISMAYLQPRVAQNSLMKKVKNGHIIQDTGTGGAYPVSTDRMIWATAAWELYKVTGDREWLKTAYAVIKNSVDADAENVYDKVTGLVKGESSFLDWREQTYPRWMQPADIFESENLGTNVVHYQANTVLSEMALLLNDNVAALKYKNNAARIKAGVNKYLWLKDKGYFGQYLYGRNFKMLSTRSEALGEALSVLFSVADEEKQESIIARTPVMYYGISCIYPQIPGIPPYHNNAVWPFVQSYWALASAKACNEKSVLESICAIYRPAAMFLTNKENFVAATGDFAGTQINSSNMLWSLSGSLSLVHKVLFGIQFMPDRLTFHPFVPWALKGTRSLTNFKYRKAILNIEMKGFGNTISSFLIDGKAVQNATILANLKGAHNVKIILGDLIVGTLKTNQVENYTAPETPVVTVSGNTISWNKIEGASGYIPVIDGKKTTITTGLNFSFADSLNHEFQVIAVDANHVESFASEPVRIKDNGFATIYEAEDFYPKSSFAYNGFSGKGFVEISKTENKTLTIPVTIKQTGYYSIDYRYSNGNGPINTENKCAIRALYLDDKKISTLVFPHRGKNIWSDWGYSNSVRVLLSKGQHLIKLSFNPANENMNGEINQAMIDYLRVTGID